MHRPKAAGDEPRLLPNSMTSVGSSTVMPAMHAEQKSCEVREGVPCEQRCEPQRKAGGPGSGRLSVVGLSLGRAVSSLLLSRTGARGEAAAAGAGGVGFSTSSRGHTTLLDTRLKRSVSGLDEENGFEMPRERRRSFHAEPTTPQTGMPIAREFQPKFEGL